MSKQESISAEDLLAELAQDPKYQQKLKENEVKRRAQRVILDKDQKDLVADCRLVGVNIQSVWDLVNTTNTYQAAIPVLVKHLGLTHEPRTTEGIVRALTTPEARGHAKPLIKMFLSTEDSESELKWLLGSAIAETATAADAYDIMGLIEDSRHGSGRQYLPLGLVHSPKDAATEILTHLASDPVMGEMAAKALRLLQD